MEKIQRCKSFFSHNEELYVSKEVNCKVNALVPEGKSCRPETNYRKSMCVMTSQNETRGKNNAHLLSQNVEPSRA